jgi:hypothetical protein
MEEISKAFAARFAHWGIRLPEGNLQTRTAGYIAEHSWLIQFLFGRDEHGEYLDYYASNRFTDDEHVRLYADGTHTQLPAIQSMFVTSSDPAEAKRLEEEYLQRNRETVKMLKAKGFDKFTINMALRTGLAGQDDLGNPIS